MLAAALREVPLMWRETPIEDADGVHAIQADFDRPAFAEALIAALHAIQADFDRPAFAEALIAALAAQGWNVVQADWVVMSHQAAVRAALEAAVERVEALPPASGVEHLDICMDDAIAAIRAGLT